MEAVNHIKSDDFEKEVMQSKVPVIVDFWAPWCAPCRMMEPALEEIAGEYAGRIKVAKINVDEEPELASRFKVFNIPAFMVFSNGVVANQKIGAGTKESIVKLFEDLI
ncbi:MAG: thioredoxin [Spirochaetales bacterium]|nr:thioredoxin [Spirochaetales bacterium]